MKKFAIAALLMGALALPQAFSLGIGGTFGLGGNSLDAGLSLKLDNLPPVFGIQLAGSDNSFRLGLTADWWMINAKLVDALNYYVGLGGYARLGLGNNAYFDGGLRIPLGLNIFVIKPLELFLEWAPSVGARFSPSFAFPDFGFTNFAIGFRFWF